MWQWMWWAGPAMAHGMNQTSATFNTGTGNRAIVNVSQRLRVGTWPQHKHLFPICRVHTHFLHWGLELVGILMSIDQISDSGIRRLTEADKICIGVVDLPVIFIKALETFMNRILDLRELGEVSHIGPGRF